MIRRRIGNERSLVRKAFFAAEWLTLRRAERLACPRVGVNVVMSDLDGEIMQAIAPASYRVVENGVDVDFFAAAPARGRTLAGLRRAARPVLEPRRHPAFHGRGLAAADGAPSGGADHHRRQQPAGAPARTGGGRSSDRGDRLRRRCTPLLRPRHRRHLPDPRRRRHAHQGPRCPGPGQAPRSRPASAAKASRSCPIATCSSAIRRRRSRRRSDACSTMPRCAASLARHGRALVERVYAWEIPGGKLDGAVRGPGETRRGVIAAAGGGRLVSRPAPSRPPRRDVPDPAPAWP